MLSRRHDVEFERRLELIGTDYFASCSRGEVASVRVHSTASRPSLSRVQFRARPRCCVLARTSQPDKSPVARQRVFDPGPHRLVEARMPLRMSSSERWEGPTTGLQCMPFQPWISRLRKGLGKRPRFLAHSPSTPTSEPLLWTVSGLTALCKPRSRFEHDANVRYSFPCLSWFARAGSLRRRTHCRPKSGTKWQLFGPFCATSPRSKSIPGKLRSRAGSAELP